MDSRPGPGLSEFWSVNLTERKKKDLVDGVATCARLQKQLAHWMERRARAHSHRRLERPVPSAHPSHARAGRRGRVPPPFPVAEAAPPRWQRNTGRGRQARTYHLPPRGRAPGCCLGDPYEPIRPRPCGSCSWLAAMSSRSSRSDRDAGAEADLNLNLVDLTTRGIGGGRRRNLLSR